VVVCTPNEKQILHCGQDDKQKERMTKQRSSAVSFGSQLFLLPFDAHLLELAFFGFDGLGESQNAKARSE
jgi:hypothetical protein